MNKLFEDSDYNEIFLKYNELRTNLHCLVKNDLDDRNLKNGTTYSMENDYGRVELVINDYKQKEKYLGWGTLSQNAKYSFKLFPSYFDISEPFRVEVDGKTRELHINSLCSNDNHSTIPNWGTNNTSEIISSIIGTHISENEFKIYIFNHINVS